MHTDNGSDADLRSMRDAARLRGDDLMVVLAAGALGEVDGVDALVFVLGTDARRGWVGRRYGWWHARSGRFLGRTAAEACRQLCAESAARRELLRRAHG